MSITSTQAFIDGAKDMKKTAAVGFTVPSTGEKCINCDTKVGVYSTMVRCDMRNYWGPICKKKECLDSVLADDDLIKDKFTLIPL